jgi:SAM-dependent methyltransferase
MLREDPSSEHGMACRICGGRSLGHLEAREMMFGLRERFNYIECHACGCVQITEYLQDLARFYPDDYRLHENTSVSDVYPELSIMQRLIRAAKTNLLGRSGPFRRRFLASTSTQKWLRSRPVMRLYLENVPSEDARILDVGCGYGLFLKDLKMLYYNNVGGIDPFVKQDVYHDGHLLVKKAKLGDLTATFDCISFHHVLEHMPDQMVVLKEANERLAHNGILIVRIPVAGGEAWRTYRQNWVQLDPPRHYYLHTERSFTMLAHQAGFDVSSIEYDSFGFQFWGSELYCRDIPLTDARSPFRSDQSIFSSDQMADYETRAMHLNLARDGDQIVAILRKKPR